MANASQLKHVIVSGPDAQFYHVMLVLLIVSITLQVIVGCILIWLSWYLFYFIYCTFQAKCSTTARIMGLCSFESDPDMKPHENLTCREMTSLEPSTVRL